VNIVCLAFKAPLFMFQCFWHKQIQLIDLCQCEMMRIWQNVTPASKLSSGSFSSTSNLDFIVHYAALCFWSKCCHIHINWAIRCPSENWVFFIYVVSPKRSANQQKQLCNDAFHVKTSQSAKNWLDPAKNKNRPKMLYMPFLHESLQLYANTYN